MGHCSRLAPAFLAVLSFGVAEAQVTVVKDVNVVHPDGAAVERNRTVIVERDEIRRVGPADELRLPDGARVIEGNGLYLLPGLTEMHAHVPGPDRGRQYLEDVLFLFTANGVTNIRGMLGRPEHLALRQQLADGEIVGPRLFTSGPSLNGNSVASPLDAAVKVRAQKAAGYDFVKQHPGLTAAEFRSMADTARAVRLPFAGHISRDAGLRAALEAGQATIDHLEGYLAALVPEDERTGADPGFFGLGVADRADPQRIAELARATAASGTAVVPTETLMRNLAGKSTAEELSARPEMRYVPRDMLADWRSARAGFADRSGAGEESMARFLELRARLIRAFRDAGATMLLGSDAPQIFNVPGFSTHRELAAYVETGLTPAQALVTGTTAPAAFLGAENWFGRVAEGMSADLILADGNPLEDVGRLRNPAGVMVRGRWFDRDELDGRLDEIAQRYSGEAGG